jgi:hypothetical protein
MREDGYIGRMRTLWPVLLLAEVTHRPDSVFRPAELPSTAWVPTSFPDGHSHSWIIFNQQTIE